MESRKRGIYIERERDKHIVGLLADYTTNLISMCWADVKFLIQD